MGGNKNRRIYTRVWGMSAMGLTQTDDGISLLKKISSPELEKDESWEFELSVFIQKHPELNPSINI
jgi:hypothetical protein